MASFRFVSVFSHGDRLISRSHGLMNSIFSAVRSVSTTSPLCAEPMKKKKRVDPGMLKMRTDRKIRKYEREIRALKAIPLQLKPVSEMSIPPDVNRQLAERTRAQEVESEIASAEAELNRLLRVWSVYKAHQWHREMLSIDRMYEAQRRALRHLAALDSNLHTAAISLDGTIVPLELPIRKDTPPHPPGAYSPPDGETRDITKQWAMPKIRPT